MKKTVSIFIIFICTSLYASDYTDKRWPFYMPRTPRLCHKQKNIQRNSGFNTAYRKEVGNAYLRQMIEDQKQEAQAAYNAYLARIQAQSTAQQTGRVEEALKIPTPPILPVTPRRTHPSCSHLRTPRNASEIRDLLRIENILPVIVKTPRITPFDTQPDHYFYRK